MLHRFFSPPSPNVENFEDVEYVVNWEKLNWENQESWKWWENWAMTLSSLYGLPFLFSFSFSVLRAPMDMVTSSHSPFHAEANWPHLLK